MRKTALQPGRRPLPASAPKRGDVNCPLWLLRLGVMSENQKTGHLGFFVDTYKRKSVNQQAEG